MDTASTEIYTLSLHDARPIDVVLQHSDTKQDMDLLFKEPLPAGEYMPFRVLFRDIAEPFTGPAVQAGGLINPKIDRSLFETMVSFEIRAGATEADARKSVASALNQAAILAS